ncbi:winged helix-turn-helix domain-containing protein [Haloterrigena salifodinae]|uniref:winged helix-turn-helix domain-containing protein n=1 Tax=Haloterrigena salifodinae TaxID=2675099 RepID=UPI000F88AFE9|nr:winged helix-turn-helix domain-containing protein [Haloterrigena salifodinae]
MNPEQLGPTQREIYDVLEDSGELTRSQITDRSGAITANAASRALDRLREQGLVSYREGLGGRYLYSIVDSDGGE